MCGGAKISAYVPDMGVKEILRDNNDSPIWKLRLVLDDLCGLLRSFLISSIFHWIKMHQTYKKSNHSLESIFYVQSWPEDELNSFEKKKYDL